MSRTRDFAVTLFTTTIQPPRPLTYDGGAKLFTIGGNVFRPEEVGEWDKFSDDKLTPEAAQILLDTVPLVRHVGKLSMLPRMHTWLQGSTEVERNDMREEVLTAMEDVYAAQGNIGAKERQKMFFTGGHTGFEFGITKEGNPDFTVLGNCSCLGAAPHMSPFGYRRWPDGFATLDMHNVDTWETQGVALTAGAGTLARLCIEQTS